MTSSALALRDRLLNSFIPAVPIPFDQNGEIDVLSHERYLTYMHTQPFEGIAVWVHTGRGLKISQDQREYVLRSWRTAFSDKLIIAGAGGSPDISSEQEYIDSAISMASHAKELGADAILCYAPIAFKGKDREEELILQYHKALASLGLPMVLFYLYEAAGGISYTSNTLKQLLSIPEVLGMKVATLNSIMTYQDIAVRFEHEYPEHLLITGEDRFFGYTLMRGAKAALVGMGSIFPSLQHRMMQAFFAKDWNTFHRLSRKVDALAEVLFIDPMEGYIGRILQGLAIQGIIEPTATFDPFGPLLTEAELTALRITVNRLTNERA